VGFQPDSGRCKIARECSVSARRSTSASGALETSVTPPVKVRSVNRNRPLGGRRAGFCSCPTSDLGVREFRRLGRAEPSLGSALNELQTCARVELSSIIL